MGGTPPILGYLEVCMDFNKIAFFSLCLLLNFHSEAAETQTEYHAFSITTNTSRVIYPLSTNNKGVSLSVTNPQEYPVLIQAKISGEDKISPAPFVITPPLFRLDGGKRSGLRIFRVGGDFSNEHESLHWLCLTGIPPKQDDVWNNIEKYKKTNGTTVDIKLSVKTCLKFLVRPEKLKQSVEAVAGKLTWHRDDKKLHVDNPTPYYIDLANIDLGGKKIDLYSGGGERYIQPFSKKEFPLPDKVKGASTVTWQIINDYGEESKPFKANI